MTCWTCSNQAVKGDVRCVRCNREAERHQREYEELLERAIAYAEETHRLGRLPGGE